MMSKKRKYPHWNNCQSSAASTTSTLRPFTWVYTVTTLLSVFRRTVIRENQNALGLQRNHYLKFCWLRPAPLLVNLSPSGQKQSKCEGGKGEGRIKFKPEITIIFKVLGVKSCTPLWVSITKESVFLSPYNCWGNILSIVQEKSQKRF